MKYAIQLEVDCVGNPVQSVRSGYSCDPGCQDRMGDLPNTGRSGCLRDPAGRANQIAHAIRLAVGDRAVVSDPAQKSEADCPRDRVQNGQSGCFVRSESLGFIQLLSDPKLVNWYKLSIAASNFQ